MPRSDPKLTSTALTIAGSDSCGGAGIQADLKTFHALNVFGSSAITAITAQNTLGVHAVETMPPELIAAQIDAVLDDLPIGAIKTGMLPNGATIRAISEIIGARCQGLPLIVDPVLVATSGDSLTAEDTLNALRNDLFPLATLVTPNLPEALALAPGSKNAKQAAENILELGCEAVLVKGGHDKDEKITDWLMMNGEESGFPHPRIPGAYHGTGCTLSAAIAAQMARGTDLRTAVSGGIEYVQEKIKAARLSESGSLYLLD